jgi:hypothetical protein
MEIVDGMTMPQITVSRGSWKTHGNTTYIILSGEEYIRLEHRQLDRAAVHSEI